MSQYECAVGQWVLRHVISDALEMKILQPEREWRNPGFVADSEIESRGIQL